MKLHGALPLLLLSSMVACHNAEAPAGPDFLAQDLDTTVSPATDFFQYANGGWIKSTTIPADESAWGIGQLVREDIYLRLRNINEKAVADSAAAPGSVSKKIGDLWYSGMDSTTINQQGLKPLQPELDSIRAIQNTKELLQVAASLQGKGVGCLFYDGAGQDDKNSNLIIFQFGQGGLGLPNRDYYFKTDPKSTKVRAAYQEYLSLTFRELGADSMSAGKKASAVFELEKKLATASRKLADLRDPNKNYNKLSRSEFQRLTPSSPGMIGLGTAASPPSIRLS